MDWEAFYNRFRGPDFIPGYEIQNRLGGGAFGDVYKARKTSIDKPYAIKFLKVEDELQREAVERELAQVRHFAAIDHPNLVSIEDLGTVMGVPFLIMGYAGEDTLARRLKVRRLEPEEALLYFTQTCRGVLALHDRRLVHFDLKPSNVFLKGDVARVGDYGLSKLLVDGRMTLSFGRGTPQYMAPEMLRSRADQRADIYSLGVLLFESLTGRLPYAPTGEGGLVLREDDDPPQFPADFPEPLRAVVTRALRLAPEDRFQDVAQLLEALGQSARQGDSVRLDRAGATPSVIGAGEVVSPPRWPAEPTSDPVTPGGASRPSDELRQTAAQLARGAVEVARGVWDGLRTGAGAAVALEEGSAKPAVPAPESAPTPARPPRLRIRARLWARERPSGPATAGDGHASQGHASQGEPRALAGLARAVPAPTAAEALAPARRRTIPVPPRVHGGVLGAVVSSVVVAFEVLVALLGNLARGGASLFRAAADRVGRRSGGLFARGLRTVVFLVVMAALGFFVMMLGMLFLDAVGK